MKRGAKDILRIFWRFKTRAALGIVCLLMVDGAQLAVPLVVKGVVDGLVGGTATARWIGLQALILLALGLTMASFRFAWRHFFFSLARKAELDIRNRILDHALTLPTSFFSKTRTGEFMALATNDVESVRQALAMGFVAGFDGSIFALVAVSAMLVMDPALTGMVILPLPLLGALMALSLRAIYNRWDAVQASFEALTEKTRESVAGMRVLRAYDRATPDVADFNAQSEDNYRKTMHYVKVDAVFHPAILLLAGSCVAILLGAGGGRVLSGKLSIGSFVAFTSYLGMLIWPIIASGWMMTLVQRASASMDRINALLDVSDVEPRSRPGDGTAAVEGALRAEGLTFTYPGSDRPSLESLSFDVPKGGSIGVVGEVGSGKSTLVHLLMRIYDPPPGTLWMDGRDIVDLPVDVLRQATAYVPQEPFLFSDTIAENLRLGKADATREEMRWACGLAALDEEVAAFPQGYETLLGERGITLSGGQKQRLCLARALLKRSPVLILDDTLSAVDADTEAAILGSLRQARSGVTTVVISHRASAVRDLDHIVVLRGGRLVARGTHRELMAHAGYYRDMVELQEMAG